MNIVARNHKFSLQLLILVCLFSNHLNILTVEPSEECAQNTSPLSGGEALRDDPNNGCEED